MEKIKQNVGGYWANLDWETKMYVYAGGAALAIPYIIALLSLGWAAAH
jgi:hypothetical protein